MGLVTIPDEDGIKTVVIGAGGASSATFDASYFEESDIVVYYRDDTATTPTFVTWSNPSDFTVTGNAGTEGGYEGGTINFVAGTLTNITLVIEVSVPYTRTSNLNATGPFPMSALNLDLSRAVAMIRQLKELLDRVVKVANTDSGTLTLPEASERANAALTFDASGDASVTALTAFPTATLTSVGTAVGTAATELAARQAIDAAANQGVETKTGDFTVGLADDGKRFNLEAGVSTVSFAAVATLGANHEVILMNNSGGAITLDPNASETINGGATKTLADGQSLGVICDGAELYTWGEDLSGTPMANPMTTEGDLIVGGASGAPARQAVGGAGKSLVVNSGATGYTHADRVKVFGANLAGESTVEITDIPVDHVLRITVTWKQSAGTGFRIRLSDTNGASYMTGTDAHHTLLVIDNNGGAPSYADENYDTDGLAPGYNSVGTTLTNSVTVTVGSHLDAEALQGVAHYAGSMSDTANQHRWVAGAAYFDDESQGVDAVQVAVASGTFTDGFMTIEAVPMVEVTP